MLSQSETHQWLIETTSASKKEDFNLLIKIIYGITGPSSAFEKWSGHERSKTAYTSAEGTSRGRAREGAFPPLVRGVRELPRENFIFPDVCRNDFNAL